MQPPTNESAPEFGEVPELASILLRHRAAVGGGVAIAKLARADSCRGRTYTVWRRSPTEIVNGVRYRGELHVADLPLDQLEIWDGYYGIAKGTNSDVRQLGRSESARLLTKVAILSLSYLRPGASTLQVISPVEDFDERFDRLLRSNTGALHPLVPIDAKIVTRSTYR